MMQHWIIDTDLSGMPSWHEAFPGVRVVAQLNQKASLTIGDVIWCRLRPGEDVNKALAGLDMASGHPVVVLSDVPDESLVIESLTAGAAGCCNSRAAPEVLRQVAAVVSNGGLWIGQSLLKRLVTSTAKSYGQPVKEGKNSDWETKLSEREAQVASLVASGLSNKEVADRLSISERTVKAHLSAIFEKLGLRDRLQLSVTVNGLLG
jgi:DNA-binding NarL/FixJ family response regulator